MSWGRVLLVMVGLLGVACVVDGSWHRTYVVEGSVEISPPGPPGMTAPAAICTWANGYQIATPAAARDSGEGRAYVLCTLDAPASVPFEVSRYSNSGHGLLIGAFLMSIPGGHPACEGQAGIITVEDIPPLDSLCISDDMPPQSEVALMAPFDDDVGRPTSTMRIAITKAR
jgi:hypothetical protein